MKFSNKIRLEKIEDKLFVSKVSRPLSIAYLEKENLLFITHINIKINSLIKWNGVSLWIPDNGRRGSQDFTLTDTLLIAHPEIAVYLKEQAVMMGKDLVLNVDLGFDLGF